MLRSTPACKIILVTLVGTIGTLYSASAQTTSPSPPDDLEAAHKRIADLERKVSSLDDLNRALIKRLGEVQGDTNHIAPISTTKSSVTTGSIHGSVWVTKVSGENQFLIGHSLYLVPLKIKASFVRSRFQDLQKSEKEGLSNVAAMEKENPSVVTKTEISEIQERINKIDAALKSMTEIELDFVKSYESIRDATIYRRAMLDDLAAKVALQTVKTDRDGRYSFDNVPSGDYVVYSSQFQDTFNYLDWAIPVHVDAAKPLSLDFFNENATGAWNRGDPP